MYQALYRKWRPKTFTEVRGQEHITKTLRSQTESGRFSHAYLFTGSRGTGKTSCAKLLARAANCEAPKHGDPCNRCPSCLGILEGSVPDVVEIDAASYSGVDHIRALREELVYSPVQVRKRVYIIDEVHMLSTGAFNALLKTLEEPPPHVLFILATTELHKVPVTVVSRCQRFAFRRISLEELQGRLWQIAQSETIDIDAEALSLLARLADGALRDGINLLDQCAAMSEGGPLDVALVQRVLGLSGLERTADWLEMIAHGDAIAALALLRDAYQAGREWASLLDELASLMRDLLLGQMLGDPGETGLTAKRAAALDALWPRPRLLTALDTLMETQGRLALGVNKRLEAELCILRLCGCVAEKPQPAVEKRTSRGSAAPVAQAGSPSTNKTPAFSEDTAALVSSPSEEALPAGKTEDDGEAGESPGVIRKDPEKVTIIPDGAEKKQEKAENPDEAGEKDGPLDTADPRWRQLLEKANPFLANFLPGMSPACRDNALVLTPRDGYEENLLDSEFTHLAAAYFPGGVRFGAPDDSNLDSLADRLEGFVTFE